MRDLEPEDILFNYREHELYGTTLGVMANALQYAYSESGRAAKMKPNAWADMTLQKLRKKGFEIFVDITQNYRNLEGLSISNKSSSETYKETWEKMKGTYIVTLKPPIDKLKFVIYSILEQF